MTSTERAAAIATFQARYRLAHRRLWGDVPEPKRIRHKPHPAVESPPAITFSDWLQLTEVPKAKLINPIPPEPIAELPEPEPPHVPIEAAERMAAKMRHHDAVINLPHISLPALIEIVAAYFNITAEAILSHCRLARVVLARHIAICLAHEINPHRSTLDLARAMHRDHTSLLWAYKKLPLRIARDASTATAVAELRAILTASRQPTMAEIFAEAAVCESAE